MSIDLVERLRGREISHSDDYLRIDTLAEEAADEIERLRKRVSGLELILTNHRLRGCPIWSSEDEQSATDV